jgi:hypothetical protein
MPGPARAHEEAPWSPDYNLAPAPEEFMVHMFNYFSRGPRLRLYRLEPAAAPENDKP